MLKNATNTTYPLYGGDIVMTLEFIREVLDYENQQTGLGLVSQQYRDFVQVSKTQTEGSNRMIFDKEADDQVIRTVAS